MARTRGASFFAESGEAFGKDGEPLRTIPNYPAPAVAAEPVEAPPPVEMDISYRCDPTTVSRNLDGWECFRLLAVVLGELSVTLTPEQWNRLPADLRRHFYRFATPKVG